MLDSYQFQTLWTQYHHHSPDDPFSLSEAIKVITTYTLEEPRDIVDRTDGFGSRGKALHPDLLDLLDSAVAAFQDLIHTACRQRWIPKEFIIDPFRMYLDALHRGCSIEHIEAAWSGLTRRLSIAQERFKHLCFPETTCKPTPASAISQIELQHGLRSSPKTTTSRCDITSQPLPLLSPTSANGFPQAVKVSPQHGKTLRTSDGKAEGRGKLQHGVEGTKRSDLHGIGSVAEGDSVRSTFLASTSLLRKTAPSIQTSYSTPLDFSQDVTGAVKSPPGLAPATITGPLAPAGFSAHKESSSMPPIPVAGCQDSVLELLDCQMHHGHSPAPAEAEDTSAKSDIRPIPGKDPPIHPIPSASFESVRDITGAQKSLSPPGTATTAIAGSLAVFNTSSSAEFSTAPSFASIGCDFTEIGIPGGIHMLSSTCSPSGHDAPSTSGALALLKSVSSSVEAREAAPSIQSHSPAFEVSTQDSCAISSPSSFLSPLERPSTPLDSAWNTSNAETSPPFLFLPELPFTPTIRSFMEYDTSSEGQFGATPQLAPTSHDRMEIGLFGRAYTPSSTCSLSMYNTPSSSVSPNPSGFSADTVSRTKTAPPVQSRPLAPLKYVLDVTGHVKSQSALVSPLGTALAKTAGAPSSSGPSTRAETPSPPGLPSSSINQSFVVFELPSHLEITPLPPPAHAGCEAATLLIRGAIPGSLAGSAHTGLPPAPSQAEDKPLSSNTSLGPGTAPPTPLHLSPHLDTRRDMPDMSKTLLSFLSLQELHTTTITRSLVIYNALSTAEYSPMPHLAFTDCDATTVDVYGAVHGTLSAGPIYTALMAAPAFPESMLSPPPFVPAGVDLQPAMRSLVVINSLTPSSQSPTHPPLRAETIICDKQKMATARPVPKPSIPTVIAQSLSVISRMTLGRSISHNVPLALPDRAQDLPHGDSSRTLTPPHGRFASPATARSLTASRTQTYLSHFQQELQLQRLRWLMRHSHGVPGRRTSSTTLMVFLSGLHVLGLRMSLFQLTLSPPSTLSSSRSELQQASESSRTTTSSTCHITSHALPPSSTNCLVQSVTASVVYVKIIETKYHLTNGGGKVEVNAEKMKGIVIEGLGSVAEGDPVRSTISAKASSLTKTVIPVPRCLLAPLNSGAPILMPSLLSPDDCPSAPIARSCVDSDTCDEADFGAIPHLASTSHDGMKIRWPRDDRSPSSTHLPFGLNASSNSGSLTLSNPSFSSPNESSAMETASPVSSHASTPLDLSWNAPNAVDILPHFRSLPGHPSTPIAQSLAIPYTSSGAEFSTVPSSADTYYDSMDTDLPVGIHMLSSMCSLSGHDGPSTSGSLMITKSSSSSVEAPEAAPSFQSHSPALVVTTRDSCTLNSPSLLFSGLELPCTPITPNTSGQRDFTQTVPLTIAPCDAVAVQAHGAVPGALDGPIHTQSVLASATIYNPSGHATLWATYHAIESSISTSIPFGPPTPPSVNSCAPTCLQSKLSPSQECNPTSCILPPSPAPGKCSTTPPTTRDHCSISLPTPSTQYRTTAPTAGALPLLQLVHVTPVPPYPLPRIAQANIPGTAKLLRPFLSQLALPSILNTRSFGVSNTSSQAPPLAVTGSDAIGVDVQDGVHRSLVPVALRALCSRGRDPPGRDKSTTATPPHDGLVSSTIARSLMSSQTHTHLNFFPARITAVTHHRVAITVANAALPRCSWEADVKHDAHGVPERLVRPQPARSGYSSSLAAPPSPLLSPTGVECAPPQHTLSQTQVHSTSPPFEVNPLSNLSCLLAPPLPIPPSSHHTPIARSLEVSNTYSGGEFGAVLHRAPISHNDTRFGPGLTGPPSSTHSLLGFYAPSNSSTGDSSLAETKHQRPQRLPICLESTPNTPDTVKTSPELSSILITRSFTVSDTFSQLELISMPPPTIVGCDVAILHVHSTITGSLIDPIHTGLSPALGAGSKTLQTDDLSTIAPPNPVSTELLIIPPLLNLIGLNFLIISKLNWGARALGTWVACWTGFHPVVAFLLTWNFPQDGQQCLGNSMLLF